MLFSQLCAFTIIIGQAVFAAPAFWEEILSAYGISARNYRREDIDASNNEYDLFAPAIIRTGPSARSLAAAYAAHPDAKSLEELNSKYGLRPDSILSVPSGSVEKRDYWPEPSSPAVAEDKASTEYIEELNSEYGLHPDAILSAPTSSVEERDYRPESTSLAIARNEASTEHIEELNSEYGLRPDAVMAIVTGSAEKRDYWPEPSSPAVAEDKAGTGYIEELNSEYGLRPDAILSGSPTGSVEERDYWPESTSPAIAGNEASTGYIETVNSKYDLSPDGIVTFPSGAPNQATRILERSVLSMVLVLIVFGGLPGI